MSLDARAWADALALKLIVVPVDLSAYDAEAIAVAGELARDGVAVHVVHVLQPIPEVHDWTWDHAENRREWAEQQLADEAESGMVRRVLDGTGGNPSSVIADYAERVGADLVVISRRGRGAPLEPWLGSVAERTVKLSRCPVLVWRGGKRKRAPRVLLPFDFSERAAAAIGTACRLAGEDGRLFAVNVLPPLPTGLGDLLSPREASDRAADEVDALMQSIFRNHGVPEAVIHVVPGSFRNPGGAIAEAADDLNADLVVIPTQGRTGIRRLLLGSVANRVLRRCDVPVLVLRPPEAV